MALVNGTRQWSAALRANLRTWTSACAGALTQLSTAAAPMDASMARRCNCWPSPASWLPGVPSRCGLSQEALQTEPLRQCLGSCAARNGRTAMLCEDMSSMCTIIAPRLGADSQSCLAVIMRRCVAASRYERERGVHCILSLRKIGTRTGYFDDLTIETSMQPALERQVDTPSPIGSKCPLKLPLPCHFSSPSLRDLNSLQKSMTPRSVVTRRVSCALEASDSV